MMVFFPALPINFPRPPANPGREKKQSFALGPLWDALNGDWSLWVQGDMDIILRMHDGHQAGTLVTSGRETHAQVCGASHHMFVLTEQSKQPLNRSVAVWAMRTK